MGCATREPQDSIKLVSKRKWLELLFHIFHKVVHKQQDAENLIVLITRQAGAPPPRFWSPGDGKVKDGKEGAPKDAGWPSGGLDDFRTPSPAGDLALPSPGQPSPESGGLFTEPLAPGVLIPANTATGRDRPQPPRPCGQWG